MSRRKRNKSSSHKRRLQEDAKKRYKQYLTTRGWERRSEKCIKLAGNRCEVCNESGCILNAHHYNYTNIRYETEMDLFCLCHSCHRIYHARMNGNLPDDSIQTRDLRLLHIIEIVNGIKISLTFPLT